MGRNNDFLSRPRRPFKRLLFNFSVQSAVEFKMKEKQFLRWRLRRLLPPPTMEMDFFQWIVVSRHNRIIDRQLDIHLFIPEWCRIAQHSRKWKRLNFLVVFFGIISISPVEKFRNQNSVDRIRQSTKRIQIHNGAAGIKLRINQNGADSHKEM